VSSLRDLDPTIDDAIAGVVSAIEVLEGVLVNAATVLTLAIDQVAADRREHLRYAEMLAGVFDPGANGSIHIAGSNSTLERGKWSSTAMLALAEILRSYQAALTSGSVEAPDLAADPATVKQAQESAREIERSRLAREIHDGPAQVLANALFIVGIAEHTAKRDPGAVPAQLSTIRDLLRDRITKIRRFMFELRPTLLEDQGLVPTLRYYVSEHRRVFGTQVSLTIDEAVPALSGDRELCSLSYRPGGAA